MTDDRDADDATPQGSSRKPRPPVIELKATDVTPASAGAERQDSGKDAAPGQAAKDDAAKAAPRARDDEPASDDDGAPAGNRGFPAAALIAGAIGGLAGALVLALVLFVARDAIVRHFVPAPAPIAVAPVTVPAGNSAQLAALAERAGKLQEANAGLTKRLAALEAREPPPPDLAPLTARLDGVEKALAELRRLVEQAQTGAASTTGVLEGRVGAIEGRLAKPAPSPLASGAEVVALGVLSDAIVKGSPFTKELGIVRAMLGDRAAALAPLEASAATGVPTVAALRAQFAALAPKLAREPQTQSGYFAQLLSSAGHLIEVRPTGEVAGTSAGAATARIEARLARNDVAAALAEAAQLPEAAKVEAGGWLAAAKRRVDAERTVDDILHQTLADAARETRP